MIPSLRKISSREKKHQSKQSISNSCTKKPFTQVLEDACEKEIQKDIHIYINGYTRDAHPLCNIISMREYS